MDLPGEKELFIMQKTQNLQDLFLNQTRKDRQIVTLFLKRRNLRR